MGWYCVIVLERGRGMIVRVEKCVWGRLWVRGERRRRVVVRERERRRGSFMVLVLV